jgi:hypothetical protein
MQELQKRVIFVFSSTTAICLHGRMWTFETARTSCQSTNAHAAGPPDQLRPCCTPHAAGLAETGVAGNAETASEVQGGSCMSCPHSGMAHKRRGAHHHLPLHKQRTQFLSQRLSTHLGALWQALRVGWWSDAASEYRQNVLVIMVAHHHQATWPLTP